MTPVLLLVKIRVDLPLSSLPGSLGCPAEGWSSISYINNRGTFEHLGPFKYHNNKHNCVDGLYKRHPGIVLNKESDKTKCLEKNLKICLSVSVGNNHVLLLSLKCFIPLPSQRADAEAECEMQ